MLPTTRRPSTTARRAAALAVPGLLVLALTGCGALDSPAEAPRESPGGEVTEAADADVFTVEVGDCLNGSAVGEEGALTESLPVVPCSEPHDGEVYAETELPAGEFPGADALQAQGDEFCAAQFETFVGIPYDDSVYYQWSLTPTEEGWAALDDRVVQCVLDTDGELVTGSLQGAAK
ncbi:septum formation family protein [Cellulomonas biazotea]|uniref:Septum formation-related domain-containing protein n=1 Tax=Cellulomonas biazotea TaxID=1709 RepID=A0A402DST7_9CELL|nr:septum formation family protein [Cellulomonas biazotea]GCE77220.1 hypothetical protein CBZ_22760 [Cellulomonas biazotea]